jgi:hypothetical protein
METRFVVDGIEYNHPHSFFGNYAVCVRPIFQFINDDGRLRSMTVYDNKPKGGLMDSEIDEEFLKEYWGLCSGY